MNVHPNTFGEAVHAVFPHFKKYGTSLETLKMLTYENPFTARLPYSQREHLWEIWQYIAELVNLSQSAWFEVFTPNGREPDMLLRHGPKLYVVEVKTINAKNIRLLMPTSQRTKSILAQSLGAAQGLTEIFQEYMGNICPYVLVFRSDMRWGEYEPEWLDFTPYMDYKG